MAYLRNSPHAVVHIWSRSLASLNFDEIALILRQGLIELLSAIDWLFVSSYPDDDALDVWADELGRRVPDVDRLVAAVPSHL